MASFVGLLLFVAVVAGPALIGYLIVPGSGLGAFDDSDVEVTQSSDRPLVATAGYGVQTAVAARR